jgi:sulfatase modifying factor 1
VAVSTDNSGASTAIVKSKTPNALGLFDMSGNVYEWCFDWDTVNSRVRRGGAWNSSLANQQLGLMYNRSPYDENNSFGFRLAR